MSIDERTQFRRQYSLLSRIPSQISCLRSITVLSESTCIEHLRMSRGAFSRLCHILEHMGGLKATRNSSVAEQVAMFLSILGHHTKNCIVKRSYTRSGRTVSKHFHKVLNLVLRIHEFLLVRPEPIDDDCVNSRWKSFKVFSLLILNNYSHMQLIQIGCN